MNYKVGDEIIIHSKKWVQQHCVLDEDGGYRYNQGSSYRMSSILDEVGFNPMFNYCGKKAKITKVLMNEYHLDIDESYWFWKDWMFKNPKKKALRCQSSDCPNYDKSYKKGCAIKYKECSGRQAKLLDLLDEVEKENKADRIKERKQQIKDFCKECDEIMKNNNIFVYIASPYTKGDVARNVYESFKIYNELVFHGYYPFSPLTSHFIHMMFPQDYEKWMDIDFKWLEKCDCVLRLKGESKGADMETEEAKRLGILVFYDIDDLLQHYKMSKRGKK